MSTKLGELGSKVKEAAGSIKETMRDSAENFKVQIAKDNSNLGFVVDRLLTFNLIASQKLELLLVSGLLPMNSYVSSLVYADRLW